MMNSGIKLDDDVNVPNEARGVSAVMLCSGVLMLLGTIIPEFTMTSFVVAILVLLGFSVGRWLSVVADGKPNK